MVFAQIKNGIIKNTIVLDDESQIELFNFDPLTNDPYDEILQINQLYPRPGIGWTYDGIIFIAPEQS